MDKVLGDENTQLLDDIVEILSNQESDNTEIREAIKVLTKVTTELKGLQPAIEKLQGIIGQVNLQLPPELKVLVDNFDEIPLPKEVNVTNLKDIPTTNEVTVKNIGDAKADKVKVENLKDIKIPEPKDEVTVKNLKDIEIPSKIDLNQPKWWKDPITQREFTKALVDFGRTIKKLGIKADLDEYRDPKRPLAVRLSNGRKFIDALAYAVSQGGTTAFPFETASGIAKAALVNQDGSVVVDGKETTDFEGGKVTVGISAVEITFSGVTQTIHIEADVDNSGYIYLGKNGVTVNSGMVQLEPGASVTMELNDASNALYAISDTADQVLRKMALL